MDRDHRLCDFCRAGHHRHPLPVHPSQVVRFVLRSTSHAAGSVLRPTSHSATVLQDWWQPCRHWRPFLSCSPFCQSGLGACNGIILSARTSKISSALTAFLPDPLSHWLVRLHNQLLLRVLASIICLRHAWAVQVLHSCSSYRHAILCSGKCLWDWPHRF